MNRSKMFVAAVAGYLTLAGGLAVADPSADTQITDRVVGKLSVDDPQIAHRVQVETKDGVVTLSGTAYTGAQALKALKDAQSVAGVVKVQNHLSVAQ